MPNVLFTRTNNPNAKSIVDGQVIFSTEGSGAIYLDNGTERLKMGADESKIDVTNVIHTLEGCVNSTDDKDVVGATVMKEINDEYLEGIKDRLTANGQDFIFDYQNGQCGYNTDPNRGADTFHPFSRGGVCIMIGGVGTHDITDICDAYNIDPSSLTDDDFMCVYTSLKVSASNDSWTSTSGTSQATWQQKGKGQVDTFTTSAKYSYLVDTDGKLKAKVVVSDVGGLNGNHSIYQSVGANGSGVTYKQSDDGSVTTTYWKGIANVKPTIKCFLIAGVTKLN